MKKHFCILSFSEVQNESAEDMSYFNIPPLSLFEAFDNCFMKMKTELTKEVKQQGEWGRIVRIPDEIVGRKNS